jgi:WXG100 family type VII secretion target
MSGPHRSFNIWDPVGDSGALRRAAASWRSMAASVRDLNGTLNASVAGSHAYWQGKAGDAFRQWHDTNLSKTLPQGADAMDSMATQLDQAADQIDRANAEIHELEIEIAATAVVGGILAFATFGATAAEAAATDIALVARAGSVLDELAGILRAIATALRGITMVLRSVFPALGREFVESLAYNTLITGVVKWVRNGSPFAGWSAWDGLSIVVSAGIQAPINVGVGRAFNMISAARAGEPLWSEPFSAAKNLAKPLTLGGLTFTRPWVSTMFREAAESGAAGFLTWGVRDEIENWSGLQHHSWKEVILDAFIGGGFNVIVGGAAGAAYGAFGKFGFRAYTRGSKSLIRPLINGPSTALLNLGPAPLGWPVRGPAAGSLPTIHPASGLGAPPPAVPVVGGGIHVVKPGESLWQIAQQAYGDPRLWPILLHENGTHITNPNLIYVGQKFEVPPLPTEELRRLLHRLQSSAA